MLVLLGGILAERYVVTWHAVLAWFPRRTVGWPRRGVGATRWDCNWCCLCVYVCVLGADADARLKGFLEAAADCIYTIERSPTALEDLRSVGTMKTAPVQTVLVLEAVIVLLSPKHAFSGPNPSVFGASWAASHRLLLLPPPELARRLREVRSRCREVCLCLVVVVAKS